MPPIAAGDTATVVAAERGAGGRRPSGETWLTVRAELAADTAWAAAGHVVARQQFALDAGRRLRSGVAGRLDRLGRARSRRGRASTSAPAGCTSLFGMPVDGPRLELWRAPTDNDRSDSAGSYELGAPEDTRGEGAPGPSSESRWRERGLDRLVHRVTDIDRRWRGGWSSGSGSRPPTAACSSTSRYHWVIGDDGSSSLVRGRPVAGLGLHLAAGRRAVRPARRRCSGRPGSAPGRTSPIPTPGGRRGSAGSQPASTSSTSRYSRPQETGHRAELRWLEIADETATAAAAGDAWPDRHGHRPGFTLTRHTPQELDQARHPYELPGSDQTLSVHRRRGARRRIPGLRDRRAAPARALAGRPGSPSVR